MSRSSAFGRKRTPCFSASPSAERHERFGAHAVDVGERAAGEGREAEAEDRADVRLARVGDDAFLERARRLQRLHREQPLLQLRDLEKSSPLFGGRISASPGQSALSRPA